MHHSNNFLLFKRSILTCWKHTMEEMTKPGNNSRDVFGFWNPFEFKVNKVGQRVGMGYKRKSGGKKEQRMLK